MKCSTTTAAPNAAAVHAATKCLIADFRAALAESGNTKAAMAFANRANAARLYSDATRLDTKEGKALAGLRVAVRVETKRRDGTKSTTEESVPVLDILESVTFGGAAIRSGKIVG